MVLSRDREPIPKLRRVLKLEYETIEKMIEDLNAEITTLNNEIVNLTWINKNFKSSKVKTLTKKVDALMDRKYELIDLLNA